MPEGEACSARRSFVHLSCSVGFVVPEDGTYSSGCDGVKRRRLFVNGDSTSVVAGWMSANSDVTWWLRWEDRCAQAEGAPMPSTSKVELYAAIRRDARAGLSGRALQRKHCVGWRTVATALSSAWPQPRKRSPHRFYSNACRLRPWAH